MRLPRWVGSLWLLLLPLAVARGLAASPEERSIAEAFIYAQRYAVRPAPAGEIYRAGARAVNALGGEWGLDPLPATARADFVDATVRFYRRAAARRPNDADALFRALMQGMLTPLHDRYARFLDREYSSSLNDVSAGSFGGVGLYIEAREGDVLVSGVIADGPAYRAGVEPFDLIVAVDGAPVAGLELAEVQQRIRGRVGTSVSLTLRRGASHTFDARVPRQDIELPTVKALLLPGGVAYARVLQFTPYTAAKFEELYRGWRSPPTGLILDLRDNPGGLLEASVEFSDLFVDRGTIVSTRSRVPEEERTFAAQPGTMVPASVPLVLLVNGGTASAAEIVAGALHELRGAWLIGERTFGKGTVQLPLNLSRGVLKITVAQYFTASGVNLADAGIVPDQWQREPSLHDLDKDESGLLLDSYQDRVWQDFARAHPRPDEEQVRGLKDELRRRGLVLNEQLFNSLLAREYERADGEVNEVALGYDDVVKAARAYLDRTRTQD